METAPGANGAAAGAMRLSARARGPIYRWLVFSIRNSSPIPQDYVIVSQRRSFVGSGILWPQFGVRQIVDAQASPGLPPSVESTRTADAYSFRLEANQTVTYALEVSGAWPDNLNLWQRNAFDQRSQQISFYHGLLLGIAALVAIYISSLFIIRRQVMFPAAALFAWAGTAFLGIEFGYLPVLIDVTVGVEIKIRAIVEAAMVFALFVALYTFVDLRKRIPIVGYGVLLVIAGCAALLGFAYQDPMRAAGLARLMMLVAGLGGLAVVVVLSRRGVIRAQVALSSWLLIGLWSMLAFLAALGAVQHDMIGPGLAAGLVLVNLMVAFTVTQYAFDAGVISSRFFEDSGRRALALAGSEQCVWDWREDQGWLYIGPELERTLGLKAGMLATAGLKGWLELMHPGDRPAYVAAVEAAIQRGRGTFAQEFRLRRKDGTYRWYQLRARALPGEQGRAGRCIGTLADITTEKRSEERMLYDAVQDRLTGLPNRALFMDRLERSMRHAQADDRYKLFVAVIDIDRFKNVNDGLGHSIGDSLLLTMARRLQNFVGPEDTLARLAGDQFAMIINAGRPERGVRDLAEQIRQAIARPVELDPREVFLTASIGVSEYMRDITQAVDVLKDAEIALYEAKRRGKNAIEFFRPTMRDDRSKLIEIESDLRRALERNEIEVAYQPIYNIDTEKLSGFEALVRWRHHKHGLLGPDEFIGIAEETGIIIELGHYVMSEAARQLGIWQRVLRPADPIFVSVNLSGRQVLDQNLVDDVKTIMSREDVMPGSLKLELTESLVMENAELSAQVLQKLKDLGVAILCDDFGTGYSSLSNLQRFPFDTLKIDRSFIHADPEDDAAMVILESIIILAHDLEMQVVAEGVENKEQLERLREFECDLAQGFYFGEPLVARAVIDALGGKPHVAEPKRGRGSRGFIGRLMRAGVAVPDAEVVEPEIDVPPRAPSEPEEAPRPVGQTLRERAAERMAETESTAPAWADEPAA
ncbi:MAG: EAL domain-containing protein, partial [Hyphomicrobiales bacterium]